MQIQGNTSFIKYIPHLGKELGRGEMVFINHLIFNLQNPSFGKQHEGKKWIFKTREQWGEEIGYSKRQIARIIHELQTKGLILVKKLRQVYGNTTNYYTINAAELLKVSSPAREMDKNKNIPGKKESQNGTPKGQSGTFSTKNTNKEINNKSEEKINIPVPLSQTIIPTTFPGEMNQCLQVKNNKIVLKKEKTDTDTVAESHSSPKTTVAQDMLAVWNHTFEKSQASMSKQLAPLLVAAYKHKFGADMQKWKQYCLTISSSPYLTGEKFNLSLFWALKYTTINQINNHEFGVKEMITSTYSKADALLHISGVKEPELCKEVRVKLLTAYGNKVYKDWFEELHFELIGNEICFKAKNNFINDYVKSKFGDLFSKMK